MVLAVPTVSLEETVDDVLRVRELVVHRDDAGEFWPLNLTRTGLSEGGERNARQEFSTSNHAALPQM